MDTRDTSHASNRIHPLMAGAAVSVMLVSMVGIAAMTGILPNSHGTAAPAPATAAPVAAPIDASTATAPAIPTSASTTTPVVIHKHVVEHQQVARRSTPVYTPPARSPQYTQVSASSDQPYQQPAQQPMQQPMQQPAQASAQTSGAGIAAGAVIGGLLGNQVGGGRGRALATVAGVVGGGYVGNEVEKKMHN